MLTDKHQCFTGCTCYFDFSLMKLHSGMQPSKTLSLLQNFKESADCAFLFVFLRWFKLRCSIIWNTTCCI